MKVNNAELDYLERILMNEYEFVHQSENETMNKDDLKLLKGLIKKIRFLKRERHRRKK